LTVACPSSHPTSFRSTSFRPCDKSGLTTNWQEAFAVFTGPFDYEVHDLNVTAHGELAGVHSLNHVNATLASVHITDLWLRWTACLRRIDGDWLVVHDHVSVPADLEHGQAALNLTP
jgi:ketosteroid isomerase-like protein